MNGGQRRAVISVAPSRQVEQIFQQDLPHRDIGALHFIKMEPWQFKMCHGSSWKKNPICFHCTPESLGKKSWRKCFSIFSKHFNICLIQKHFHRLLTHGTKHDTNMTQNHFRILGECQPRVLYKWCQCGEMCLNKSVLEMTLGDVRRCTSKFRMLSVCEISEEMQRASRCSVQQR